MNKLDNLVVQRAIGYSGRESLYNLIKTVGINDVLSAIKDYYRYKPKDIVWNTDEADICYADGQIIIFKK